jgi:hypothetical protein
MDAPASAACPRCGALFHCGSRDAVPCPCSTVTLDEATLRMLRERWTGCLCLRCLRDLADAATRHV